MRKFSYRGLRLEQFKEPAISNVIEEFYDIKTVYLPVSDDLNVSPNEHISVGELVSRGDMHDSVDSFSSLDGVALAVGEFECEKFEHREFLKIDATDKLKPLDIKDRLNDDLMDKDISYASNNCGIINTTDKRTLKEICEFYADGVENLVIDAVDDEPYVSNKSSQLLYRSEYIAPAIKAINRIFGAKNISISVYADDGELTIKLPKKVGKYPVNEIRDKYPVSKRMQSDKNTVYIDIEALLGFYYSAVLKRPWTKTVVTVAGDAIENPRNIEVPIGTPIGDILEHCGLKEKPKTIILGGSMTGYEVYTSDTPVLRSTKAILAFKDEFSYESTDCIGCGKCIDVCPEKLLPYYIYNYYLDNNIEKLYRLSADKCIECGCCSYICPAKIDLRQIVKKSRRTLLKEMWQNEQGSEDNKSAVSEK